MKFCEIPKKCRIHILVYSVGTKATRLKAAVHYASHSLSRGNLSASDMTYIVSSGALNSTHSLTRENLKNFMPRSFISCVPALLMQFQAQ